VEVLPSSLNVANNKHLSAPDAQADETRLVDLGSKAACLYASKHKDTAKLLRAFPNENQAKTRAHHQ
jgi:hypothetical protein